MVVDPEHRYSYESEKVNYDICDWKKNIWFIENNSALCGWKWL